MKDESHPDGWQCCCYDARSMAVPASAPSDVGGCVDPQTSDWAVSELPHTALKEARKKQGWIKVWNVEVNESERHTH